MQEATPEPRDIHRTRKGGLPENAASELVGLGVFTTRALTDGRKLLGLMESQCGGPAIPQCPPSTEGPESRKGTKLTGKPVKLIVVEMTATHLSNGRKPLFEKRLRAVNSDGVLDLHNNMALFGIRPTLGNAIPKRGSNLRQTVPAFPGAVPRTGLLKDDRKGRKIPKARGVISFMYFLVSAIIIRGLQDTNLLRPARDSLESSTYTTRFTIN